MALFRKRKKEEEVKKKEESVERKRVVLPLGKKPFVYKTVAKPIVTERAVDLSHQGKYVFKVFPRANKVEIKKAVAELYEVKVKNVRVMNAVGKKRQIGRQEGRRPGFKKAIVTLERGYKIETSYT